MRILVVEDGAAIRNQVAERLRNDGFVVDTAGDWREGMNCATEYPINLAVVDLGLPEMDGIELTEHIHAEDHDRDSNVIKVFVGRLRKKIDPKGEFKPIETLRGRGYRFNLPRSE